VTIGKTPNVKSRKKRGNRFDRLKKRPTSIGDRGGGQSRALVFFGKTPWTPGRGGQEESFRGGLNGKGSWAERGAREEGRTKDLADDKHNSLGGEFSNPCGTWENYDKEREKHMAKRINIIKQKFIIGRPPGTH